jgi:hypothetical protein
MGHAPPSDALALVTLYAASSSPKALLDSGVGAWPVLRRIA